MLPPQNDVFISYLRRDSVFVRSLNAAFRRLGRDPWVDWEDGGVSRHGDRDQGK